MKFLIFYKNKMSSVLLDHVKVARWSLVAFMALFSIETMAVRGRISVVKVNQAAAQGRCLVDVYGDSAARLVENRITTFTGTRSGDEISFQATNPSPLSAEDVRSQSVVKVMQAINNIGDQSFDLHKGAKFVFGTGSADNSRQEKDHIQINRSGTNQRGLSAHDGHNHGGTTNAALIAHELGHYVGNKGMYQPYFSAVSGGCNVSGYAQSRHNGRNEEFAEVFAAYITNPELLSAKGGQCQKALDFFRDKFGESAQPTCESRLGLAPAERYRVARQTTQVTRAKAGLNPLQSFSAFLKSFFTGALNAVKPQRRTCASVGGSSRGRAFCNPNTPTNPAGTYRSNSTDY